MTTSPRATSPTSSPRSRRRLGAVVLLGATSLGLGLGACGTDPAHPPTADVSPVLTCDRDDSGRIRATGEVHNNSSEPSFYAIDVTFAVGGEAVGSDTVTIESLDPGARQPIEATVSGPDGTVTCSFGDVLRLRA